MANEITVLKNRDEILDCVRGLSALIVLFAHARAFLFVDLGEVTNPNMFQKGFYFASGVHHQAVMVFFVLSGYFVGGGVLKLLYSNKFSWRKYIVTRLTRLWLVLGPAIALTIFLQLVGQVLSPDAYAGRFHDIWMSGPNLELAQVPLVVSALGNLLFVQTIAIPAMATNGPLWSLAFEFWYYSLFPLMVVPCGVFLNQATSTIRGGTHQGIVKGFLCISAALGLLTILPWGLVSQGMIWILGVVVWELARRGMCPIDRVRSAWMVLGLLFFVSTLVTTKIGVLPFSDFAVGAAFALWMLSLVGVWKVQSWAVNSARFLADISFTLYVTHFPVLLFACAILFRERQYQPNFVGFTMLLIVVTLSFLVAILFWWMFERRTDDVRRGVDAWTLYWPLMRSNATQVATAPRLPTTTSIED